MSAARRAACAMALAVAAGAAQAELAATDAWVRGTVPAQKSTGAYMALTSTEDARLVAVSTPVAKRAEMHSSSMRSGVMHMHAVEAIELPRGRRVELKPGGLHVMLLGLSRPLAEGESVPLTLTLEGRDRKRTSVEISAQVRPLGSR